MPNKALLKEFQKGFPGALYFLWSDEAFFLDEALSKFIEAVPGSGPVDFNYDVFYPSASAAEVINAAATLPFMAKRRLLVLKDFHMFNASAVKALKPYFREPAESTCMLILSQKAPASSLDIDWKIYHLNINEREIPEWVRQTALKKGIRLTGDAIDHLIDCVGYEIGPLIMEIEKMSLLGKNTVSSKDLTDSVSMMREYSTFDLVDSLVSGESARAFRILKSLFSGRSDPTVIIGTLNWHYKQFYSLWVNKGKRPAKMREKTYRALAKYVPSFKEENFFRIFQNLHDADLGVKSSGKPELVLEALLLKLLQQNG